MTRLVDRPGPTEAILLALGAPLLVLLLAGIGEAVPRYSLRVGQGCVLCHQTPSGGGARSPYASQVLVPERLAMRGGERKMPNPQISEDLAIGADLRTFWMDRSDRDARNNFVQMQGALYATLLLDPRVSVYVHEELGQGDAKAFELCGLGWISEGTSWVKVGRFVPAFGWRPADHRTFTRTSFVFFPENPPQSDTGIEIGARAGGAELQVALTNGEFGSPFELNDELALVARGSASRAVGPLNVAIGGSYAHHRGVDLHRRAGGPFAGVSWARLTWWGEADWMHGVAPDPEGGPALREFTSFTTSHEVAIEILQGLDLVGTYDFHDADVHVASGAGARIGGGIDVFPRPFLQLRGKLDWFDREEGPAPLSVPDEELESQLEVHLLY